MPRNPGVTSRRARVHRVMGRIASLGPGEREAALERLLILAGLRNLGRVVDEEARKMPILNDIRDHEVLGEEYKNGARMVLRPQIEKRFGAIPSWAEERLLTMSYVELEALGGRVLDAHSLEELLR